MWQQEIIDNPRLPLAVYREVAAHLQLVEGVGVEWLPQTSREFDYLQSQVGGLLIRYPSNLDAASRERLDAILAHYARHYGISRTRPG